MTTVKKELAKFGVIFAGWTALAILWTLSGALYRIVLGAPARFFPTLWPHLLDYWIWAFLTPVIFLLAKRFPFKRETLLSATALHFCFYLILTFTHSLLAQVVGLAADAPVAYQGSILWLRFVSSLYDNLWMYWPAVVVWSLLDYYRRYRDQGMRATELKEQLARAELQVLRHQLHPHFLFNTLNSIASLMHEDVHAADDMLGDLSQLLRACLARNGKGEEEQEIRLRDEIQLLETYIRIQRRRFEDRLSSVIDIPPELLDTAVPSLLLQPLVENSILHGIAPRPIPGCVRVSARKDGSTLHLEVTDDGAGLAKDYVEGIGLSNTRSRLYRLYDGRQSFELTGGPKDGATVKISIPLKFFPAVAPNDHTNRDRGRRTAGTPADRVLA
jgi:two-component system LytT family sensor kinase